jgi:hypothetical protein
VFVLDEVVDDRQAAHAADAAVLVSALFELIVQLRRLPVMQNCPAKTMSG